MESILLTIFLIGSQTLYLLGFLVMVYFFLQPVNWVDMSDLNTLDEKEYPQIILFYPVLRELEETMRTTFLGLSKLTYPKDKYRVIAIPNYDDSETISSLTKLQGEFPFLKILSVPPTTDPSWNIVFNAWEENSKAYWWHTGKYAKDRNLPPKKTRQLVYAFYQSAFKSGNSFLLNYIDADSVPPKDHFLAAAAGFRKYDVMQSTNIAGNPLDSWASTFHAMDHMAWDGLIYPHLSSNGRHPFWVLGKGLFYKSHQLYELGSFNPWLTIEDPEIGMRLWANGKKLGIIEAPLIEEVPVTFANGITQRKRWVCGFFQSLAAPVRIMGMSSVDRFKARLNIIPCLFLLVNIMGLPTGIWLNYEFYKGNPPVSNIWLFIAALNISLYVVLIVHIYTSIWNRSKLVLKSNYKRILYLIRINPLFLWFYWIIWTVPIFIGFNMFIRDTGKVWDRTVKIDANHKLVRQYGITPAI